MSLRDRVENSLFEMFRFAFRALLPVIWALLTYQVIAIEQRTMSNKAKIMSNISLALYWAVRNLIPIAMVPNKTEWLNIDGSAEQYPPGEKYSPMNGDYSD